MQGSGDYDDIDARRFYWRQSCVFGRNGRHPSLVVSIRLRFQPVLVTRERPGILRVLVHASLGLL